MVDDNELDMLRNIPTPAPSADTKARALAVAMAAYDLEKILRPPKEPETPIVSPNEHESSGETSCKRS